VRTTNFPQKTSHNAERLASFRQQMADFARGERLRKLREGRHLSQEDAAHEIGVSVKSLRSWEKGSGIRWNNAQAAAEFYGVEPESLVSRELMNGDVDLPHDDLAEVRDQIATLLSAVAELDAKVDSALDLLRRQPPGEQPGESHE
jgi:transcriptional regulator with XRE-family HTH domain